MSYPPPRYFGTTGKVTARYRPASTPPDLPRPGGAASYLATGATTNGRFGLYRWDMGPEVSAEGRWQPSHDELLAFFEEHDNIYV